MGRRVSHAELGISMQAAMAATHSLNWISADGVYDDVAESMPSTSPSTLWRDFVTKRLEALGATGLAGSAHERTGNGGTSGSFTWW